MKKYLLFSLIILTLQYPIFSSEEKSPVHHLFPQEKEMYPYFIRHGIDPHEWCIVLPIAVHKRLESANFHWNAKWKVFIIAHPISSQTELFGVASALVVEAGIEAYCKDIVNRYGKKLGKKFPPDNVSKSLLCNLQVLLKNKKLSTAFEKLDQPKTLAAFYLAFETYNIIAALDDDFRNNEYVEKALSQFLLAIESDNAGKTDEARRQLGMAYYLMGYGCFSKGVEYRSDFSKEVADKMSNQSQGYFELAEEYLSRAVTLDKSIPFVDFHLGMAQKQLGETDSARENLQKAMNKFRKSGDLKFLDLCKKELEDIDK